MVGVKNPVVYVTVDTPNLSNSHNLAFSSVVFTLVWCEVVRKNKVVLQKIRLSISTFSVKFIIDITLTTG